jgi:DNA-binding transcriptional ArsR family regulator
VTPFPPTTSAIAEAMATAASRWLDSLDDGQRRRAVSGFPGEPELVGVDATNLVAVLNSLEDAGLIDRRRNRADRRRAIIALSDQGEQLLANLDRALREVDDEILSPLTGAERETLNDLLSRAVQHIAADSSPPARGC